MSRLSERVEKAKELVFTPIPGTKGGFSTYGSKGDHYQIMLSHKLRKVCTPDNKDKMIRVITTDCQKTQANSKVSKKWAWTTITINGEEERVYKQVSAEIPTLQCTCKGNDRHTVCYHSIGAIFFSFKNANRKSLISFYETYEEAVKGLNFGGEIAMIENNTSSHIWCIRRDWPTKPEILTVEENIALMRGDDEEGID